jgi:hypothetical protein
MPITTNEAPPPLVSEDELSHCCNQWTWSSHHLGVFYREDLDLALFRANRLANARAAGIEEGHLRAWLDAWSDEWIEHANTRDEEDEHGAPGGRGIYDYSYKPRWRHLPSDVTPSPDHVFLGAEIETECVGSGVDMENGAEFANSELQDGKLGILKEDGSLDYGFEIVTQPMTYSWAMANFPWTMFEDLHDDHEFRALDTAGVHVHVSRKAFETPGHLYRWMGFVHRNPEPIQALARRGSNRWSDWNDRHDREHIKNYAKGSRDGSRYVPLNVQNTDTIEARFFRASLRPQAIQASLGFMDASVAYTRHLDVPSITKSNGWHWSAFREFVDGQGQYEPLQAEIEEKVNGSGDAPSDIRPVRRPRRRRAFNNYPSASIEDLFR